jgi:hypothetical protein
VQKYLTAVGDPRTVVADTKAKALYFGVQLDDRSLTPGGNPRLGTTVFAAWLASRLGLLLPASGCQRRRGVAGGGDRRATIPA